VDFKQKLIVYRKKFHSESTLKFVDFIETLLDWVDTLYEKKRLSSLQKEKVKSRFPSHIFEILNIIQEDKVKPDVYIQMKEVLLKETEDLIGFIIKVGELRLSDFDWLQFNLYQIFGKEQLASMVEWARLTLGKSVDEKQILEKKKREQKIKREQEHMVYINSLSQTEMNHLAYTSQWDFTPSAQTQEERDEALERAYETIVSQKQKFRNFELRLVDATTEARGESQSMVFRKIGEVRLASGKSAEEFRKKAKFIVSSEGPRKEVLKAKKRIGDGRVRTQNEIKASAKMFTDAEKMFSQAQKEISERKSDLHQAELRRRESIKKQGQAQLYRGERMIYLAKDHMDEEKVDTEKMFSVARGVLSVGKSHLEDEKKDTEKSFSSAREYLSKGKERMEEEKVGLSTRIKKDEQRIEGERQRIIALDKKLAKTRETLKKKMNAEKLRLAGEREKIASAGSRFGGSGVSAMDKIAIVKQNLVGQRKRVVGQAKAGITGRGALMGKGSIRQKFMSKKEKLEKDLIRKRDLLAYDVRFKQHSLQESSKEQKEFMTLKFEHFQDEQKKLLARHRATRKAKMVRTLLRAIREMK
jgi:hypothetical protein